MFEKFARRSYEPERLDRGDYTEAEYARWQKEMVYINRLLGDSRALAKFLKRELSGSTDSTISILDVGAGAGVLLKTAKLIVDGRSGMLVGAEIHPVAARDIVQNGSVEGLLAVQCDGMKLPFADGSFDFVISSLFLHHFRDEHATEIIREMRRVARRNFMIVDLHRHPVAYYTYLCLGHFFLQRFTIEDGSLSVLRGFRPVELRRLAGAAGVAGGVVERRAAFRLVLSGAKARLSHE